VLPGGTHIQIDAIGDQQKQRSGAAPLFLNAWPKKEQRRSFLLSARG
jgi:hypothetical protein